jgi:hypothetical protein
MDFLVLDTSPIPFTSFYRPELAFACAAASPEPGQVVLGDCLEYWVVSAADAERLQRAGYPVIDDTPVAVHSTGTA